MNIKKSFLRWSVAALAVLMLAACGSSTSSSPDAGVATAQKAQTGQVTFSVQFPQEALKKALIDDRTASIYVQWRPHMDYSSTPTGFIDLVPNASGIATATVEVPVGAMEFMAIAQDSSFNQLDMVTSAGVITTGSNTVTMTFLGGDWQFVDAADNPLPQTFGTTTLAGFSLSNMSNYSGPAKATTDPTLPRGWSDYNLQWQTATAAIGPVMWSGQTTQFNGIGFTGSSFGSDWLNITEPTRSDSLNNDASVPYVQGDRLVWILEWEEDGPTTITDDATSVDLIPQFKTFADTQVLDGNHLGGHLMAMTFESLVQSAATGTGVDCTAFWYAQKTTPAAARAAAIKASLAKPAGKAAIGDETTLTAGTATVTYSDCYEDYATAQIDGDGDNDFNYEQLTYDANGNWRYDAGDTYNDSDSDGHWDYTYTPGTTYDFTEVYSNIVAREFRAKGSQAGSVFTPPAIQASAVGTWITYNTATASTAILTFIDDNNYMMGEDGTPDTTGAPGIEVGTYIFDPATSATTFTASYETNGDRGATIVGTPTTYPILGLTESTLTVADPIDGTPFSFNRVVPDPTNPIVGSWYFTGTGMGSTILVLLNNGQYYAVQVDDIDTNNRFFETGTYSWNNIDGTFVGTGVFSSNPANSAIAAPGDINTSNATVSGNTLNFFDGVSTYTATRL